MSTTRCRIPIGFFYGHMVIKSDELSNENSSSVKASPPGETEKHLANLSKLFEDISCRYSISCSKLKDTLQGFIVADVKNASHLLSYMNTMKEKNSNMCSLEHNKVFQAYRVSEIPLNIVYIRGTFSYLSAFVIYCRHMPSQIFRRLSRFYFPIYTRQL